MRRMTKPVRKQKMPRMAIILDDGLSAIIYSGTIYSNS